MSSGHGDGHATAEAVACVDVVKRFGKTTAVDGVSVAVRKGEFFSILGPSGCGKSTLLRMISGFEQPTSGEIQIQGRRVNEVPPHRRDTNLVFQNLALFPHMDVFENVSFALRIRRRPRGETRRRVGDVLELVGLGGYERRRTSQLSGGQQQRVAIARALVNEPAVLLLDEPLGALDLKLRIQMQRELKAIQHRVGTTFIYVTHDQSEALSMSDRMVVMNEGRVQQIGSGADLYLHPANVFVAGFLGETNLFEGEVLGREGDAYSVRAEDRVVRASAVDSHPIGATVTVSVRPEQLGIAPRVDGGRTSGWSGRVTESTFLGTTVRHDVQLASGKRIRVDQLAGAGAQIGANAEVEVSLVADFAVLVADRPRPEPEPAVVA